MLRGLYDWTIRLAGHRHATAALFAVSFAESSIFPVPPDAMLVPMILANPRKAWLFAGVCTVASVLGGLVGYGIGYFLYDTLGKPILQLYGQQEQIEHALAWYREWGAWIVAIKGFTPIPYKVVTITSGFAHLDIWAFVLASIVSRIPRFFLVAALLRRYGDPIRAFIEKRLYLVTTLFLLFLIGGFVVIEYLI
ncbi:MAG: YqaA family protein [Alphaproteobacteria bacterium]